MSRKSQTELALEDLREAREMAEAAAVDAEYAAAFGEEETGASWDTDGYEPASPRPVELKAVSVDELETDDECSKKVRQLRGSTIPV